MNVVTRRLSVLLVFAASLFPFSCLHAQVTATAPVTELSQYSQRWDVFGGAQYAHFNPSPNRGVEAINLLGWNGSATVWVRPVWGIEASARGAYGNIVLPAGSGGPNNPPMSEHLFLFGPNFRFLRTPKYTFGMHALFGAAYGKFSTGFPSGETPQQFSIYNDKLAFGAAVGASGDYNLSPKWSVRLITDWQPTYYGYSRQNEFAGAVGIVYKLGSLHK
uniref:Outer membrane protein beta-barrel domain-containing protein n=1 Tax=Paracidobacterium acidisoli TaxID=2303751 RepID=A0A372IPD1_9BACT